jgi:hypothetical protein
MTDALIFDVPMELGLKLVPIVGAHFPDSERKLVVTVRRQNI